MSTSTLELFALTKDEENVRSSNSRTQSSPPLKGVLSMTVDDEPVQSIDRSILIQGHASNALDLIPEQSIQTVVTSPPYWSLRGL